MPDSQDNLNGVFSLAIDVIRLGITLPVDEVTVKNVYVDVDDTHIRVVPFDFTADIDASGLIVNLPPTTLGSIYEIQLLSQGKVVLSAYFDMPKDDCFLSDLPLYTAFPPRESYPVDVVNWGDIKGSLTDQTDLSGLIFTKTEANQFKKEIIETNKTQDTMTKEGLKEISESLSGQVSELAQSTNTKTIHLEQKINTDIIGVSSQITILDEKVLLNKTQLEAKDAELQGQINANGGGKFGYVTYAEMEAAASLPADDPDKLPAKSSIDIVNDPDGSKNGTYAYDGTTFTKSLYDSLTLSKGYTDTAKQEAIAAAATDAQNKANAAQEEAALLLDSRVSIDDASEDLEQKVDVEGRIYSRYAADGELYLTNMSGKSVQESLLSIPKYLPTSESDILNVEDDEGKIIVVVDKDAGLLLPGINGSVQDNINRIAPRITNARRDKKWFFTDATQSYLSNMYASGMGYAPVPLSLLPSNYTVPNTIVDDLKLIPPTGRLSIDTPYYQDDWVVHPFIFECIGTIRGYRYIMAINPYKFESHENPVIYGSNDLDNFEMLTGFDQPLDTPPEGGFLSDSGFTYDPASGELICYWRITRRPDDGNLYTSYWCKRTKDLLNWTDKEQFFEELENGVDGLTSPAILFDPSTDLWHLWNIKVDGVIVHRTAKNLFGVWSAPETINIGVTKPWHIEVRWVGNKMVMLINKRDPNSNYFLGISADGTNWTFSSAPMFDIQLPALYKATFLPKFDVDDNFYLEVLYTTNHNDDPELIRRLYHTKTNSITI